MRRLNYEGGRMNWEGRAEEIARAKRLTFSGIVV
jgi:hypothetical protein